MKNSLLVTGMFRSGTTLLSKMINANPNIACFSDCFLPIFKLYRNHFLKSSSDLILNSPFDDYYFSQSKNKIFNNIQKSTFKINVKKDDKIKLKSNIKIYSNDYSPEIHAKLHLIQGKYFDELFKNAYDILTSLNKKKIVGFKDVWVGEFSKHIIELNNSNKVINIIRDPRSVISSNFASGNKYPIIFLIRQWRKLASLAILHSKKYPKNFLNISYEDLIINPELNSKKICSFLKVNYSNKMIDHNYYYGPSKKKWIQNTSLKKNNSKSFFNKKSIDYWPKILSNKEVRIIEYFCQLEMSILGYDFYTDITKKINFTYKDNKNELSKWIKKYCNLNNKNEIIKENNRINTFKNSNKIKINEINKLFLNQQIYKILKTNNNL